MSACEHAKYEAALFLSKRAPPKPLTDDEPFAELSDLSSAFFVNLQPVFLSENRCASALLKMPPRQRRGQCTLAIFSYDVPSLRYPKPSLRLILRFRIFEIDVAYAAVFAGLRGAKPNRRFGVGA